MNALSGRAGAVDAMIEDNAITSDSTPEGERVSGAALVGLWLLIPSALAAVSYAILGIAGMLLVPTDSTGLASESITIDLRWWLGVTLALQVGYWLLVAPRPLTGLWAVLPVIALIPTFFIARETLLDRRHDRARDPLARADGSSTKAIWTEAVE